MPAIPATQKAWIRECGHRQKHETPPTFCTTKTYKIPKGNFVPELRTQGWIFKSTSPLNYLEDGLEKGRHSPFPLWPLTFTSGPSPSAQSSGATISLSPDFHSETAMGVSRHVRDSQPQWKTNIKE
jgi:hypothetical protein